MATSVQVLCPNGRRQNVKVTPNTKLLQVLEEVCTKQAFHSPDDYDLIHGRKALDLTLAFRFSNLPNNAKLELVKSTTPRSQASGEVTIALQLESGERLQHSFQPSVSLWQILQHWEAQDESRKGKLTCMDGSRTPPVHPVCIYMRDEVIGETALQFTTLKKLALTSGKAIIRLVHRPVDDGTLAQIMEKIAQEEAKLTRLAQKALEAEMSGSTLLASSTLSQHVEPVDMTVSASATTDAKQDTAGEEKMEVDKPVQETVQGKDVKKTAMSEAEPMDTQDVKPQSSEPHKHAPKVEGTTSTDSHASCVDRPSAGASASGASAIEQLRHMNIPGVDIITPRDFDDLSPEQQDMARKLMEQLLPGMMRQQQQTSPKPRKPKTDLAPPYAGFKFPEETKGKDLYRNELSEVNPEEFKPCDRETVIYDSNEQNASKAIVEDPPEDFFEVTDADVKSLYKDLKKQVSEERPLMTESMRQLEVERRHQQYHHVVIRVQFPDGLVLQGCFRPRETVHSLHKFVKEHLEDKGQTFCLYRSPPKQIFNDMAKSLVQADLAPASLVYFSSDKTEEHSLSSTVQKEVVTKRRADELSVKKLAKKQMERLTMGSSSVDDPRSSTASSSAGSAARNTDTAARPAQRTAAAASGEAKTPKWLKMGKK